MCDLSVYAKGSATYDNKTFFYLSISGRVTRIITKCKKEFDFALRCLNPKGNWLDRR